MRRNNLIQGDQTTSGGRIIGAVDARQSACGKVLALEGDEVYCPKCKTPGRVVCIPPRNQQRFHGRQAALDGDLCICKCTPSPRISSSQTAMGHNISPETMAQARESFKLLETATVAARLASSAPPPAQAPQPSPAKLPVAQQTTGVCLRIGVFFDGTNNNASNTALGEQCRASRGSMLGQSDTDQQATATFCKPFVLAADGSYDNGITNVARLHQLYEDSTSKPSDPNSKDYYIPIYVDGIGTTAGQPDSGLSGQAFGAGETGMSQRVAQTIAVNLSSRIKQFIATHSDRPIDAIEFDAFGFSRGAAAARHFVNEVNRSGAGPLAAALSPMSSAFKSGFNWQRDIRVGFVGLFDTVVAYGSVADGLNVRSGHSGPLHVGLPAGCARQVVQICARDEVRANFMLTTVKPQHRQISMPGVHSDVGGSYCKDREGPLLLIKPLHSDEALIPQDGELSAPDLTASAAWRNAERARQQWKAQRLGGLADDYLKVDGWRWIEHRRDNHASVVPTPVACAYATVLLDRPVDWRYQLIPLRMMHKVATEAGVPLDFIDDNDPKLALPNDLKPIAAKLLAEQPLDATEDALLRRKYLHVSAHWMPVYDSLPGRGPVSVDLVYVNRPDPSGERQVLPNE